MAYQILRLDDPPGLCVAYTGTVTGEEVRASFDDLAEYVRRDGIPEPIHVVWDARGISALSISPDDLPVLDRAMQALEQVLCDGPSVIVYRLGKADVHVLGKLLFARAPQGRRRRATFTDYDEAIRWLKSA